MSFELKIIMNIYFISENVMEFLYFNELQGQRDRAEVH